MDEDEDYSSEDIDDIAVQCLAELKSGKLQVKNSVLCTSLKTDLVELALPPVERVHKLEVVAPQREVAVTNKAKQSTEAYTQAMHEHNQVLQSSMEALQKRCKTLEDKEKNIEERHKKGLEEVTNKAKQSTEAHTQVMHEHNQVLLFSMEALQKRCKTLEDKEKNIEEKHKKELEEVTNKAKQSTEAHTQAMHEHNQVLQSSMEALQKRCKTLEDKEKNMKNEADRTLLEQEKTHNRRQLDKVNQQTKMQKKHHTDQLKLIKKHEEESKKLEVSIQQMELRLAKQHQHEVESRRAREKFMEFVESLNVSYEEIKSDAEGLETKVKAMEEQKKEYEEELVDLKEENESSSNMIGVLINQHRTVNDELEEARKLAVVALIRYGNDTLNMKRVGEIDPGPWNVAYRQRRNSFEDWEILLTERLSEWEDLLQDPNFHPFKMVKTDQGKDERKLDENNKDLAALKSEFGEKVFQTVVTAHNELEEYNSSGRYPIPVAWNFKAKRRATMEEVIRRLMDEIRLLKKEIRRLMDEIIDPKEKNWMDEIRDPKEKKGVKRNAGNR